MPMTVQSPSPPAVVPSPNVNAEASRANDQRATQLALLATVAANAIWGLSVFLFKALAAVPPLEVTGQRIVWSLLLVAGWITITGRWGVVSAAIADRRSLRTLFLSALFCGLNWVFFVWAVVNARMVESSFGYFISPILIVVIGTLAMRERLSAAQKWAVGLVTGAVLLQAAGLGVVPWVSLGLAANWALYVFVRKRVTVPAVPGFFIECLILSVPAIIGLGLIEARGAGHFLANGWPTTLLLLSTSFSTAVPLILFAASNNKLRMVTLGLMQYVAPTIQFALAALVYGEPVGVAKIASFALIWIALLVFTIDAARKQRA